MSVYDILWVGDLRFPGGTGTAIAEEIAAGAAAGYRLGVITLRSSILAFPHPINPRIRRLIDQGAVTLLDPREPAACRLCCLYHPQCFVHFPIEALRIDAELKLLVATHPPHEGDGTSVYDVTIIDRNVQELMGGDVKWAPVGPSVRRQLEQQPFDVPLLELDWVGVIDQAHWQQGKPRLFLDGAPVIGRHSRPDATKWPDTREDVLTIYPNCPEIRVKVLGYGPFLRELVDPLPANWQVYAFNQISPVAFLQQIGVFVYFHHSKWVEAFGYAILEALAARVPVILPVQFEQLFQDAAVYAKPTEALARVEEFYQSPELYREQCGCASQIVAERFSQESYRKRVEALIGQPQASSINAPSRLTAFPSSIQPHACERQRRRAVFLSSNGVGMGHLTRQLAIARRLPSTIDPIFLTMSRAAPYVEAFDFPVEYLPFHGAIGCDIRLWNHHLRRDLTERFAFYRPDVVVFDGNVPYDGLINAMASVPACPLVWCRRAMWTAESGSEHIGRERFADAVIEPAEIAGEWDQGLTRTYRSKTRQVDPILLLDEGDRLPPEEAKAALGLAVDRPTLLMQLGAGNNFDVGALRTLIIEHLQASKDLQIVWLDWAIAKTTLSLPPSIKRIKTYPLARYLNAFDMAVSAAGYNAYHELLASGIPTVFIPNEHPMMDDQLARALYADVHGLGLLLRRSDHYRVGSVVARLLDPKERAAIRKRCARLEIENGAIEAAQIIDELAYCCRVDLDPARDIAPALRRFGG